MRRRAGNAKGDRALLGPRASSELSTPPEARSTPPAASPGRRAEPPESKERVRLGAVPARHAGRLPPVFEATGAAGLVGSTVCLDLHDAVDRAVEVLHDVLRWQDVEVVRLLDPSSAPVAGVAEGLTLLAACLIQDAAQAPSAAGWARGRRALTGGPWVQAAVAGEGHGR